MSENKNNSSIKFTMFSPLDYNVIKKIKKKNLTFLYKLLWIMYNEKLGLNIKMMSSISNTTEEKMKNDIKYLKKLNLLKEL